MLKRIFIVGILVFCCALPILGSKTAHANINSCSASVNPAVLAPSSTSDLQFLVNNTDTSPVQWVSISSPSSNYVVNGGSGGGWNQVSNDSSSVTYQSGSIDPGGSAQLSINVSTDSSTHSSETWSLAVSDDPNGANPFNCSGSLSTTISGQAPDTTPPNIYNISVIPLTINSVKVTWLTDESSTSQVDYGEDSTYGNTIGPDSNFVTSHSVNLSGLSADTGYHFMVSSADASGNIGYSNDNTFLTQAPIVQNTGGNKAASLPINVPVTNPADKIPPTITFSGVLPKVAQSIPTIHGNAADDLAVSRVEYSTDNGRNWLPVDNASGIGGKTVAFSFTPSNLDDGNYKILARAIDAGGNTATTTPLVVVIDRLPPIVGGNVISLGPQVLGSNTGGEISTLAGVDEKITLSAVGGPTGINLTADSKDSKIQNKTFSLTQSADSGLWSGILSFGKPGMYNLVADAVDGAGNKTTKIINTVSAAAPAKVLKANGQPASAKVTAYYLEPDSNSWVIWDANAYGQDNPQTTDSAGSFRLFLPSGTYYLKAAGKGFATVTTSIFKLHSPSPILTTLKAGNGVGFLGSHLSKFSIQQIGLNFSAQDKIGSLKNNLLGKQVPDFSLTNTAGQTISPASLLGRPTILSFMSSWAPATSDQLPALNKLASNQDINVEPIALQQNANEMRAYQAISGYGLDWLADPDSAASNSFSVPGLPTHYFIDRNGIIKKIVTGLLSEQELLNNLSSLN